MKILYDHQTFAIQEFGGISRYFLELMNQYHNNADMGMSFKLSLKFSNNKYLEQYRFIRYRNLLKNFSFPGKGPFLNQINKFYSIPFIRKHDFDVFHPTYYDPYFLRYIKKKPFIVTVYDMIHEIFPQYFPLYNRVRMNKHNLVNKADKIIAISHNTKKDLIAWYNIEPEKIHVIHLGNPLQETRFDQPKQGSSENLGNGEYLFFVGNRQHYKNFQFFITSIEPLLKEYPELRVVCAGGGKFSDEEVDLLEKLGLQKDVFQVNTNDQELKKLYSGAKAFVFPSLYEGFGLPILEAFSCRCPAILSNTSSLPEIGGDAAIYFDPFDGESMREAVKSVLDNESIRMRMIDDGVKRLEKFSWERTAKETKLVYQTVYSE